MPVYAAVFVGEAFLLALYYYTWERLNTPSAKWVHMSIGLLANVMGVILLVSANAWASFMMAPSGVDGEGHFLGNVWNLLHSPLWNPLNAHRFLADIMSGGAVVVAYATYRFFMSKTSAERAYYDWVACVFMIVMACRTNNHDNQTIIDEGDGGVTSVTFSYGWTLYNPGCLVKNVLSFSPNDRRIRL